MSKVTSDGSTASYYELPEGAKELQHLISFRNMNGQLAEIFRACYRYGIVSHSDQLRDAKKMVFYAMAEVERLEKWSKVGDGQHQPMTPNFVEQFNSMTGDAFDEVRADIIGQNGNGGEHYSEVHGDSHVPTEDMTDPSNWREGDWVVCVDDGGLEWLHEGSVYRITGIVEALTDKCLDLDGVKDGTPLAFRFKHHARPDADGWIEWEGGECPVGIDTCIDMKSFDMVVAGVKAGDMYWGLPFLYRPHLATSQDKG